MKGEICNVTYSYSLAIVMNFTVTCSLPNNLDILPQRGMYICSNLLAQCHNKKSRSFNYKIQPSSNKTALSLFYYVGTLGSKMFAQVGLFMM